MMQPLKMDNLNLPSSPTLGINLNIESCGIIKVGDPVYAVINDNLHKKLGGIVGIGGSAHQ